MSLGACFAGASAVSHDYAPRGARTAPTAPHRQRMRGPSAARAPRYRSVGPHGAQTSRRPRATRPPQRSMRVWECGANRRDAAQCTSLISDATSRGAYCCAGEHSTFISLQTRSTLSMTSAAAFGLRPTVRGRDEQVGKVSPSGLTLMPAICSPLVN